MKFIREAGSNGVRIPKIARLLSGLDEAKRLELHTMEHAIVLLKDKMSAADIVNATQSINHLCTELLGSGEVVYGAH